MSYCPAPVFSISYQNGLLRCISASRLRLDLIKTSPFDLHACGNQKANKWLADSRAEMIRLCAGDVTLRAFLRQKRGHGMHPTFQQRKSVRVEGTPSSPTSSMLTSMSLFPFFFSGCCLPSLCLYLIRGLPENCDLLQMKF